MKHIFTVFSIVMTLTVFAQGEYVDCLSPTPPQNFGMLRAYEKKVDEILLSQLTGLQLLMFRQSETIWVIELDTTNLKNPNYFMTAISPSRSIRQSMPNTEGITVSKITKHISSKDYYLIKELFDSALNSVCARCNNFGIDGASYTFSNLIISGRVWLGMPNTDKTKKERLVLICKQINELANTDSTKLMLDPELQNRIIELTEAFNKQNANH